MGDAQKQWHAIIHYREYDLLYAPCQTQVQLLGYLRSFGLFRKPIVVLAHHPILKGKMEFFRKAQLKWQTQGVDFMPSLSAVVSSEINRLSEGSSEVMPWGPDLEFYKTSSEGGSGCITAGRTNRDILTFGTAATAAKCEAKIICLQDQLSPEFAHFGKNVSTLAFPRTNWMPYRELIAHIAASSVVAIPLLEQPWLAGLSSLADALGAGKPIIMTRNRCIDLDIEKEKIGIWVDPGDVKGWTAALEWFDSHPEEARSMGARAREIAKERCNSRLFGQRMMKIFEKAMASKSNAQTD